MDFSEIAEAKQHEIQHLLIALDQLGRIFGLNRDIYYTLGQYLGYTDISLLKIESKRPSVLDIMFYLCQNTLVDITEFISKLEHYFIQYGHWDRFRHFTTYHGFSSLLSSNYWKLY